MVLAFYIARFAHHLGFASQSKEVTDTANRIVSRMKRDWMVTGRRPAGICGAAFVMAARLHGFKCCIEDITKIVKIGHNSSFWRKQLHGDRHMESVFEVRFNFDLMKKISEMGSKSTLFFTKSTSSQFNGNSN